MLFFDISLFILDNYNLIIIVFYLFYTICRTPIRQSILITFSKKQIKKSAENNTSFDVYLLPFSLLNGIICFYTKQTRSQLVNSDYTVKFTINQDQISIFYCKFYKHFFHNQAISLHRNYLYFAAIVEQLCFFLPIPGY